ncbi:transcriptional repressor, partial [Pseudoalteromonas sp. 41-MNA-CIBAN-0057]
MSVYRILGFLESVGLVHRLKLENKFIPCSHFNDDREHQLSMFLICSSCNKASEVNDLNNSVKSLFRELKMKGFTP